MKIYKLWVMCSVVCMGMSARALDYGQVDVHDPDTQIPGSVRPLFDTFVRDLSITPGPEGWYYMTGTTERAPGKSAWDYNDGLRVWKSKDLKKWEPLGLVWSLDKDCKGWQKNYYCFPKDGSPGKIVPPEDFDPSIEKTHRVLRHVWAPEIDYVPHLDTFVLSASMNHNLRRLGGQERMGHGLRGGCFMLVSTSGKAEGPYRDIQPEKPLTSNIDASFFVDDDHSMYFLNQDCNISRLKDDLPGLEEQPWRPTQMRYPKQDPRRGDGEGGYLFKTNGKYHLSITKWSHWEDGRDVGSYLRFEGVNHVRTSYSYDPVTASSESIKGPYGKRYTPITGGGHGNFFQDHDGGWWACVFWNPRNKVPGHEKYFCRPAIVAMKWVDGRLRVDKERTDEFYAAFSSQ